MLSSETCCPCGPRTMLSGTITWTDASKRSIPYYSTSSPCRPGALMKPVVIENPILNSPFDEPSRHFLFDDDGITDQVVEGRRRSSYVTPVAAPKQHGRQQLLDAEWAKEKNKANDDINH